MTLFDLRKSKAAHTLCKPLAMAINKYLYQFPLKRKMGACEVLIPGLENLACYEEFSTQYPASIIPENIEYIIDLGCNIGMFAPYVSSLFGKTIKGIGIDANRKMVSYSTSNANRNGHEVFYYWGAVGIDQPTEFIISDSNVSSSLLSSMTKGKKTLVLPVNLRASWDTHFPSHRVDLVKINIEGAELMVLRKEKQFFKERVDAVIVEIHDEKDQLETVSIMEDCGLRFIQKAGGNAAMPFFVFKR